MLNLTVMGVLLAYFDTPRAFRQFGINAFGPETGREVHAALSELVAAGDDPPYIGRRIGMDEVGAALADHAAGRTSGRTVVQDRRMNADQLVAEAREQTGLDDLGPDGDVALAGLAAYVEACDAEADLSELGGMVVARRASSAR